MMIIRKCCADGSCPLLLLLLFGDNPEQPAPSQQTTISLA